MKSFLTEKREKLILCVVFILAIFLITFHFTDTPKVWVDEGVFTETAKNLAMHGTLGLQTAPNQFFSMRNFLLSTSYPVIFPVALSLKLFGTGIWQARLPMIIYMFFLVLLFYLFAKKKYGFYPALTSVLLLLSFSPFYGNGRPVQGEVPGLVFLILGSYLLLLWEESRFQDKRLAILSGLAFGLSASTKPIFLVIFPISFLITLFFCIKRLGNRKRLRFFVLGFVPPILLWAFVHIPTKALFLTFVSKSLYLASNHDVVSVSPIHNILTNFLRFFTESTPILFAILFATVAVAILTKTLFSKGFVKETDGFAFSEYVMFFFIVLNWLTYLVGTGWYRYFFPAHTLIYLLFPASIIALSQVFDRQIFKKGVVLLVIILIVFQFYHLVFLSDTSFVVDRTRNTKLTDVLSKIDSSQKVLFYNVVETAVFLKGDNYSQYLLMGDFLEAGNKNVLNNASFNYILTNGSENDIFLSCYDKKPLSQYSLFKKIDNCQK